MNLASWTELLGPRRHRPRSRRVRLEAILRSDAGNISALRLGAQAGGHVDRQVGRARDILPMLGNRVLTAIGASALNRSYGQPSLAHAQVSGLGLRLWRGLSSLPGAAIRARFASFSGRAVISFSAVPEASWRCASADC